MVILVGTINRQFSYNTSNGMLPYTDHPLAKLITCLITKAISTIIYYFTTQLLMYIIIHMQQQCRFIFKML